MTREVGPVPRSLLAFWQVVGGVDLRGSHPAWARTASLDLTGAEEGPGVWLTDPLCVARPDALLEETLDEAVEGTPYALCIAPDLYGKAGYSGGTLSVWTPVDADDAPVEGAQRRETLVEHLRRALRWGGFPGFEFIEDRPEEWLAAAIASAI